MAALDLRRVDFGWFVRPAAETGTGSARVEALLGYLLEHDEGLLLFDTGMGRHPDVDAHYRPRARGLEEALGELGVRVDEVTHVVNCHLHIDHCGGNPRLTGRPVLVQATELAAARSTDDYTLPELVDVAGLVYEELDGPTEVLPGVVALPTPGHTDGHQSLVVRRPDGVVVVAGQSHDSASQWSADALAVTSRSGADDVPLPPAWVDHLLSLDPRRVVFAHDHAVWEPSR
jgi:N-acyl homoserine lactone hydrolase